jgi:hypothetical protein
MKTLCFKGRRVVEGGVSRYGAHKSVGTAPLWAANSAEQNGIGINAQLTGVGRERGAQSVDRRATDQARLEIEPMTMALANGLKNPHTFGCDLSADAVAGEDADQGFHERVPSKRVMASA